MPTAAQPAENQSISVVPPRSSRYPETSEPSSVLSEMATIVRSDWPWTRSAGATDSFAK